MRQTNLITWKHRWMRWSFLGVIAVVIASLTHSRLIVGVNADEPRPLATCMGAPEKSFPITASFANQPYVSPEERVELLLARTLNESEGQLAVFIDATDVSSLFTLDGLRLRYNSKLWPLPLGESTMTVYLVSENNEWKEAARFTLRVGASAVDAAAEESAVRANFVKAGYSSRFHFAFPEKLTDMDESLDGRQETAPSTQPEKKKGKMKFAPSLALTAPSQPAQSTFPGPKPARATFIDLGMQASIKNDSAYGIFSTQSEFNFAGSSVATLDAKGKPAPKVDLSSYLIHVQTGKLKYDVGAISYGTQRYLINGFSSRGISITVPFLKRFDFSAAAMNGTQVVGFGNFLGLNSSKHQLVSGTLGVEFFPEQPGEFRLEVGALNAYRQPSNGVNRAAVTDLERSHGVDVRLIANDKEGRFHYEIDFTRSFFFNPKDSSLSQGDNLTPLPSFTRDAGYLEASYKILRNYSLTKTKKANLEVTLNKEYVASGFASLGASPVADNAHYELSVKGSINEIVASFQRANSRNNLREITSQPRVLGGTIRFDLTAPASALLNRTKSSPWLPTLAFGFNRLHNSAIPVKAGIELDSSLVKDSLITEEKFNAGWQVKKFNWSYNVTRTFTDNRLKSPETNNLVHTGAFGIAAAGNKLNFTLNLMQTSSANKITGVIDRTYSVGPQLTWQFTKHMNMTANLAQTIAGNAARTNHSRNTGFDGSWNYQFARGQGLKKVSPQFSIRYSNTYSHSLDRIQPTNTLTKHQALIANLGVTFF
jgi:hypothetical protein